MWPQCSSDAYSNAAYMMHCMRLCCRSRTKPIPVLVCPGLKAVTLAQLSLGSSCLSHTSCVSPGWFGLSLVLVQCVPTGAPGSTCDDEWLQYTFSKYMAICNAQLHRAGQWAVIPKKGQCSKQQPLQTCVNYSPKTVKPGWSPVDGVRHSWHFC